MTILRCLGAAALISAIATPALARPQWIAVSASGDIHMDYNSVRSDGPVRSVIVSLPREDSTITDAATLRVNCKSWQFNLTIPVQNRNKTTNWEYIGRNTVAETVATSICPN